MIAYNVLNLVPDAVKHALDEDTLNYLQGIAENTSDLEALRDAIEPFLVDAGMSDSDLTSLFAKLSVDVPAEPSSSSEPVPLPDTAKFTPTPIAPASNPIPASRPRSTSASKKA
ncbi:hypothetical protein IWW36_005739, partial [Coemansia brasiliensis]